MCGRYTITRQEKIVEDLQASLGPNVMGSEWWKPRFNVAPTQPSPVITLHDGARTVEMMRWGLVPFWATNPNAPRPPLMINARLENLHTKQWFREALDKRRCLVPADGFFEWQKREDDPKHPQAIYLRPESRKIFAFAGLWAKAKAADGSEALSFAIITCPPNELVKPIHDRMPLVLSPDTYEAWLDPLVGEVSARALLEVPPVGDWKGVPVSSHVNKATNDDPTCVEPLAATPATKLQLSLF